MKCCRVVLVVLVVPAVCTSAFCAMKVELKEFTCPLDGTKFTARALVETDGFGGVDSDFCSWPKGSSGMPYEVQVCPKCFYATRSAFFNEALSVGVRKKLQAALAKWRKDHNEVTTVEGISPGRRWELTAICGIVKHNHPSLVGNLWLRAAWATRHHALRGLKTYPGDPMSAFEVVDQMEADLKKEKNETKLIDGTLQLAMVLHRAGDSRRRDTCLNRLSALKLNKEQSARVDALKKAFAAEALYQQRAVAAFNEVLEKETVGVAERHVYLFMIADTTRRLGKPEDAVKIYRKVKASGKIRRDIAGICDFMINWLDGE